jgi:hypothetical protein
MLRLHADLCVVYYGLALSYGLLGQYKNELLSYKKALDLNPGLINFLPIKQRKILVGQLNKVK